MGELLVPNSLRFNLNIRFFTLDAINGTLIKYKSKKDFPMRPRLFNFELYFNNFKLIERP